MENNLKDDEIIIDWNKIAKTIWYRKHSIIVCFILVVLSILIFTLIVPKQYTCKAKLLVNKSGSTNLSDLNPFIISETKSGFSAFQPITDKLNDELEIIKSSLVIDQVIKQNNLRYKRGPKKGQYLSKEDFLKKNISFDNSKGSNVIEITYKSKNPDLSYNIVNSIINRYQKVHEDLNLKKALKDTEFLKTSYLKAQESVDKKISKLKQLNSQNMIKPDIESSSGTGLFDILLSKYDKRIKSDVKSTQQMVIENKKPVLELNQEIDKLNLLKNKYEWSNLVEKISENASNIIILENPVKPALYDYTEPNLIINLAFAFVMSLILSIGIVVQLDIKDEKLTYLNLDKNIEILDNKQDINISNIEIKAITNKINQLSIVSLIDEEITREFIKYLNQSFYIKNIQVFLTIGNDNMVKHIENIVSSENIIIFSQINSSERKVYYKIKEVCKDLNKDILEELCFSEKYKILKNTEEEYVNCEAV